MGRFFHDGACHADGIGDVLHANYRTDVALFVHDAGIQGHVTVAIWSSAIANTALCGVVFALTDTLFDGIQGLSTLLQRRPSGFVGLQPEIPGGDDHRSAQFAMGFFFAFVAFFLVGISLGDEVGSGDACGWKSHQGRQARELCDEFSTIVHG